MNKCDLTLTICVFFQHDYQHKGPVYRFLRKVMALPFLPWEQIETAFEALNDQVTTPKIARFMKYVKKPGLHTRLSPQKPGVCTRCQSGQTMVSCMINADVLIMFTTYIYFCSCHL